MRCYGPYPYGGHVPLRSASGWKVKMLLTCHTDFPPGSLTSVFIFLIKSSHIENQGHTILEFCRHLHICFGSLCLCYIRMNLLLSFWKSIGFITVKYEKCNIWPEQITLYRLSLMTFSDCKMKHWLILKQRYEKSTMPSERIWLGHVMSAC